MSPTDNITPLRIGTRKSPLALAQVELVRTGLLHHHPDLAIEVVPMTTSGDTLQEGLLADVGGKGLFTKEIEEALLLGAIDIAVHSAKDMQTFLPQGLVIGAVLPREDARDVLIAANGYTRIEALPEGARFGTASLRRAVQVLHKRPDLQIVPLRGNVHTRLRKIAEGQAEATLLALAGLKRLRIDPLPGTILSIAEMLPAAAQGAIAVECRAGDDKVERIIGCLQHRESTVAIRCERAMLAAVDGSCRTPVAAYATLERGIITLQAMLATEDGKICRFLQEAGAVQDAETLGIAVGQQLKSFFS